MILSLALEIKRFTCRINVIVSKLKNVIAMATGSLSEHGRLKVSMKWTHFERQSSSKWSEFYFNIFQRSDWLNPNTTRDHYDPPRKSVKFLYVGSWLSSSATMHFAAEHGIIFRENLYHHWNLNPRTSALLQVRTPILFVLFVLSCSVWFFLWNKVWSEQRFNCR